MHVLSKFSRRRLLGTGAGALALAPFLPRLQSHAGSDAIPKRLILLYTPCGTIVDRWRPTGNETDWQLSEILSPLAPYKSDLVVLDGVDVEAAHHVEYHPQGWGYGGHHAICSLWTGVAPLNLGEDYFAGNGISVDQYLGQRLSGETPFDTLQFGVAHREEDYWKNRMSFAGPQSPVAAIDDPIAMFETIYGDLDLSQEAAEQLKRGRLSVIDSVAADLRRLEAKMSKSDQVRTQGHLAAIRQLEQELAGDLTGCSATEPQPAEPGNAALPVNGQHMMRLMVDALACDATRVATLMWSWENSGLEFPFLDLGLDDTRLHGLSHDSSDAGLDAFAGVNTFFAEQLAALLQMLTDQKEIDGSPLLDHTIVVWATPMSNTWRHSSRNVPIVVAGGGGAHFETDRLLRFGSFPDNPETSTIAHAEHGGRPMNDLFISLIHAMGFPEVDTFGDPAFCTGPIL